MKFLQVHNFYDPYLRYHYGRNPELANATFKAQTKSLVDDGFSGGHLIAPYFEDFGWESTLAIANCMESQAAWCFEHGIRLGTAAWMQEIVFNQIEVHRPDILYISHPLDFDSRFLRLLRHKPTLIIGWRAAAVPEHLDFTSYDVMFTSDTVTKEHLLRQGAKHVEFGLPGFPRSIAERLRGIQRAHDVVFCGQYTRAHGKRNELLRQIADSRNGSKEYSVAYHLLRDESLPFPESVSQVTHPALFGFDMYKAMRQARISFNAVIDFADGQAGNMRQFEAIGSGSFLLTEYHDTLQKHFEPGVELETYKSAGELIEKIRYYLDNAEKREEISRRGQERCLREHSMESRAERMKEICERHIHGTSSGASTFDVGALLGANLSK